MRNQRFRWRRTQTKTEKKKLQSTLSLWKLRRTQIRIRSVHASINLFMKWWWPNWIEFRIRIIIGFSRTPSTDMSHETYIVWKPWTQFRCRRRFFRLPSSDSAVHNSCADDDHDTMQMNTAQIAPRTRFVYRVGVTIVLRPESYPSLRHDCDL